MKRLLHTPLALLVWRIALLYAALMLCRAAFWVYNAPCSVRRSGANWGSSWPGR